VDARDELLPHPRGDACPSRLSLTTKRAAM
jgi:hypothetical protein